MSIEEALKVYISDEFFPEARQIIRHELETLIEECSKRLKDLSEDLTIDEIMKSHWISYKRLVDRIIRLIDLYLAVERIDSFRLSERSEP